MSDKFTDLPTEKLVSVGAVLNKWSDPNHEEDPTVAYDWRSKVMKKLKEGDIDGMRKAATPSIQYKAIELAHEAKNEQTQLQAIQFVLGQEGQGVVQKVHHTVQYDQMPADQIMSVIASKLARMAELIPGFSPDMLLEEAKSRQAKKEPLTDDAAPIDAEFTEVP